MGGQHNFIQPLAQKQVVKYLGLKFDHTLSMKDQVNATCAICFATMCPLSKVFPWLPFTSRKTLDQALITSLLD